MPNAAFVLGDHEMEVRLALWGREEYYLDGRLLLSQWKLSGVGTREFRVGTHVVRIVVSSKGTEYFCRVFVDGEVYIDELFPQLKAMVEQLKGPSSYFWPALAGALVAGLVAAWRSGLFA